MGKLSIRVKLMPATLILCACKISVREVRANVQIWLAMSRHSQQGQFARTGVERFCHCPAGVWGGCRLNTGHIGAVYACDEGRFRDSMARLPTRLWWMLDDIPYVRGLQVSLF